ncbi:MAG: DUF6788 family protein [Planctomycetota bacterium]
MKTKLSRERRQLWRLWGRAERLLRLMQGAEPICPGSLYLLRRRCGKSSCRCLEGKLHETWVVTRSEQGRVRLYSVPGEDRAAVRRLTDEYRTWQRSRAALVKTIGELLRRLDAMAGKRLRHWPKPKG